MRTMPRYITGDDAEMVAMPTLPAAEWCAKLAKIAGRPLTDEERTKAAEMAAHNWTLRMVGEALFGEHCVNSFFGPPIENEE